MAQTDENSAYPFAYAGLVAALQARFPEIEPSPPAALRGDEAPTAAAAAWALEHATGGRLAGEESVPPQRPAIFTRLFANDRDGEARFVPLRPLRMAEAHFFPQAAQPDDRAAAAAAALGDQLAAAVRDIAGPARSDPATTLAALDGRLQRLAWGVAGGRDGAVSLFAEARAAAALAPCYPARSDETAALLLKGDLSGVQDYIYTITSRGAASGLRGRSLYLQLLTDAVAYFTLNRLNLPPTSILFSAASAFVILVPADRENALDPLRREITGRLLAHHQIEVRATLAAVPLAAADFLDPHRYAGRWQALDQEMDARRRRPLAELGADALYEHIFDVATTGGRGGGEETDCAVCHHEETGMVDQSEEGQEPLYKCRLCLSLEELGKELRTATDLLYLYDEPGEATLRVGYQDALRAFGLAVYPLNLAEDQPLQKATRDGGLPPGAQSRAVLAALRDDEEADRPAQVADLLGRLDRPLATVVRYTVRQLPAFSSTAEIEAYEAERAARGGAVDRHEVGHIKPFDVLAAGARGVRRLGVLRMDVDDLGALFAGGLGDEAALTRTIELSHALSFFFEGWVGQLAAAANRYPAIGDDQLLSPGEDRDVVYSVYAGGDDLFFVAAWDVLPRLAWEIRQALAQYAAGNPRVHLSGGITLHGGKFPLYQAARAAQAAEDAAKARPGKDAFTFLGRSFPWEIFSTTQQEFELLHNLIENKVPRSLLQQLIMLDQLYAKQKENYLKENPGQSPPAVFWGKWHWVAAYQMGRLTNSLQGRRKRDVQSLYERLELNRFNYIEVLGIAARWAELSLRLQEDKKQ